MTYVAEPCTRVMHGFLDALTTGDPDRIAARVTGDFQRDGEDFRCRVREAL
ncbi:hypothetical protein ACFHYQ_08290 [Sphaerimonospora cavernae]|uniref:Uncharacterized protein n=1 Tax=Sphaerimonospora cavernae TaxID=1740611 RepID=A0ABV6U1K9_9ACTN